MVDNWGKTRLFRFDLTLYAGLPLSPKERAFMVTHAPSVEPTARPESAMNSEDQRFCLGQSGWSLVVFFVDDLFAIESSLLEFSPDIVHHFLESADINVDRTLIRIGAQRQSLV